MASGRWYSRLVDEQGRPTGVAEWDFKNSVTGRWLHIRDRAVVWVDGRVVRLEIALDITARKGAEEQLAIQARELAEANRLKDLFIDIMRHDLLNPLAGLQGALSMLQGAETDARRQRILQLGLDRTQQMTELILGASKLAQLDPGTPLELQESSLTKALHQAAAAVLGGLPGDSRTIEVTADGEHRALLHPMILDVVVNLLSNAAQYSPSGSSSGSSGSSAGRSRARGSGWPSWRASWKRTADASGSKTTRAVAVPSSWTCSRPWPLAATFPGPLPARRVDRPPTHGGPTPRGGSMPYDEGLAERIRDLLMGTPGLVEKKMFGGIGFIVNGHMACGAHSDTNLLIRCGKSNWEAFCAEPGARAMERGGKGMSGWVLVDNETVLDDSALEKWVHRGRDHAAAQPPK